MLAAGLRRERTGRAAGAEPGKRLEPTERPGAGGDGWGPGVPDPGSAPHAPHTGRVAPGRFSLCPPARSFLPCRHRGGGAACSPPPPPRWLKAKRSAVRPPPHPLPFPLRPGPDVTQSIEGSALCTAHSGGPKCGKFILEEKGGGRGEVRHPPHSWTAWVRDAVGAAAVTAHLEGKVSPVDQPQRFGVQSILNPSPAPRARRCPHPALPSSDLEQGARCATAPPEG